MNRRVGAVTVAVVVAACGSGRHEKEGARVVDAGAKEQALPAGTWGLEQSQAILDKTQTLRLEPDLAQLTAGERTALDKLFEVGRIFQGLYEGQRHAEAANARAKLAELPAASPAVRNLTTLYRLNQGPIATTLDNQRVPFLPVDPWPPGRNVYPWNVTRQELDDFLAAHPERREAILAPRTVVRRVTAENVQRDVAAIEGHEELARLHAGVRAELVALKPGDGGFYAVPYPVAYADELVRAAGLLREASAAVEPDDAPLARYLRLRADGLLTNDYEASDAAWVEGRYHHLNAQLGSYETYDDKLYGVKTFFGASLLALRGDETERLRPAIAALQRLENSLPHTPHGKVRPDIPVGVYDVIADFGQCRGGNTATILPNDPAIVAKHGRTVLIRANILLDKDIFQGGARVSWEASVAPEHAADLGSPGDLQRTLWHEIGHYLGVHRTKDGRDVDTALLEEADAVEEMKADLVSLYVADALAAAGVYDQATLRNVLASGISRVVLIVKPQRDQPYETMELVQWNWFLEKGLLSFDPARKKLVIHYDQYHRVVSELLQAVLELQDNGDKAAATAFIDRYSTWQPDLHETIAGQIRAARRYRFRLFTYAALGE